MTKLKLGVLISGRGTNLQALIDACADPDYPAEIVLVISNVADAYGLSRAQRAGIATETIEHTRFRRREKFEKAVDAELEKAGVELVCLAGFMRLLQADFVSRWHDKMINIHPSLLPSFRGLNTHQRALDEGVRVAGCTIHFVRQDADNGPIIAQAAVPVTPGMSAAELERRVLESEHRIYPMAVRLIAEKRATIENDVVHVTGVEFPEQALLNPAAAPERRAEARDDSVSLVTVKS